MDRFRNQIAVITGASSGIGRAIALGLAEEGAILVLTGRNIARLEDVADTARRYSPTVRTLTYDLNIETELASLVTTLKNELPRVDLLIHCAGTVHLKAMKLERVENLDEMYRVNLRAPFLINQALLPAVLVCQGQIVFINSSAGSGKPSANNGLYACMKHALHALADGLREEVNHAGVRVITLFPGRTATPMQAQIFKMEGRPYHPELLIQPEDVVSLLKHALALPRTIEVTDLHFRPLRKSY